MSNTYLAYAQSNLNKSKTHALTPDMLEHPGQHWKEILDFFGVVYPNTISWLPIFDCTSFYWITSATKKGVVYYQQPLTYDMIYQMTDVSVGAIVPCLDSWLENVFVERQGFVLVSMYYLEKNAHGLCIFSRFRQNNSQSLIDYVTQVFG